MADSSDDDASDTGKTTPSPAPAPAPASSPPPLPTNTNPDITQPPPPEQNQRINPETIPRDTADVEIPTFETKSGKIPPRAPSEFIVVDEGNASPRFLRLTYTQVPNSPELIAPLRLPLGAIIQPLAPLGLVEEALQLVDFAASGPPRCRRCRAYVNHWTRFVNDGTEFLCNFCETANDVPPEYQSRLDSNGVRRDVAERPELCRGSVEFIVPQSWIDRPTPHPAFLFVLDMSSASRSSGLLASAVEAVRFSLAQLPQAHPGALAAIVAYDSTLTFFKFKAGQSFPRMQIVADVDEPFLPSPSEELFANPSTDEGKAQLEACLQMVVSPAVAASSALSPASCFGAAAQAAYLMLESTAGKAFIFYTALPTIGCGKLNLRQDSQGGPPSSSSSAVSQIKPDSDEKAVAPQSPFYTKLAEKCVDHAVSVDILCCTSEAADLATIGQLPRLTGGQLSRLPAVIQAGAADDVVREELARLSGRETGWDAALTVRTSKGFELVGYHGNFLRRPDSQEVQLAAIDCDKAIGLEIRHIEKRELPENGRAAVQAALLYYNDVDKAWRIRVHTASLPLSSKLVAIYRNVDIDALLGLVVRKVADKPFNPSLATTRTTLVSHTIDMLTNYRKRCATNQASGQLVLPETLKLWPVFILSLCKHDLLNDASLVDDRAYAILLSLSMPMSMASSFITPRLFALHSLPPKVLVPEANGLALLAPRLRASYQVLKPEGVYLLDGGTALLLWVGSACDEGLVRSLFDFVDREHLSQGRLAPPTPDPASPPSRVNFLVDYARFGRPVFPPLYIINRYKHHEKSRMLRSHALDEKRFLSLLMEDGRAGLTKETPPTAFHLQSYVSFLCYLHKEIMEKMLDDQLK